MQGRLLRSSMLVTQTYIFVSFKTLEIYTNTRNTKSILGTRTKSQVVLKMYN